MHMCACGVSVSVSASVSVHACLHVRMCVCVCRRACVRACDSHVVGRSVVLHEKPTWAAQRMMSEGEVMLPAADSTNII